MYPQGTEIVFTGELEFSLNEVVNIEEVKLKNLSGPTPLDAALPLISTSGVFVNVPVASGTLMVKVDFIGLSGGTSTNTTIPGTTLPGGIDGLKGVTSASKIVYTAKWSPPAIGTYSAKLTVKLKNNSTLLESAVVNYSVVAGSVVTIVGPSDINEASGTATYIIKVTPPTGETIIVEYATVDGSAVAGEDFTGHATTTASFDPGNSTSSIEVAILDDNLDESAENFSVVLVSAVDLTFDPRPVVTTIVDNDDAPTITLASTVAIAEGDTGTSTVSIPVTLSAAAGRPITVSFATQNGTANSGVDYVAQSGTLTIDPEAALERKAQLNITAAKSILPVIRELSKRGTKTQ
ncbi:MAG: hypothetical protein IIB17_01705, partial [Chloroflexi bacterium]|nr:hypothetical protein [Chloroflexota bacterium]